MNMQTEPTAIITAITAFATAIFGVLAAFGLNLDDAQRNAILGCIPPVVVIIAVAGAFIRSRVVSPKATGEAVAIAKTLDPQTTTVPDVKVAGYRDAAASALNVETHELNWRPPVDSHQGAV